MAVTPRTPPLPGGVPARWRPPGWERGPGPDQTQLPRAKAVLRLRCRQHAAHSIGRGRSLLSRPGTRRARSPPPSRCRRIAGPNRLLPASHRSVPGIPPGQAKPGRFAVVQTVRLSRQLIRHICRPFRRHDLLRRPASLGRSRFAPTNGCRAGGGFTLTLPTFPGRTELSLCARRD